MLRCVIVAAASLLCAERGKCRPRVRQQTYHLRKRCVLHDWLEPPPCASGRELEAPNGSFVTWAAAAAAAVAAAAVAAGSVCGQGMCGVHCIVQMPCTFKHECMYVCMHVY